MRTGKKKSDPVTSFFVGAGVLAIAVVGAVFLSAMLPAKETAVKPENMSTEQLYEEIRKASAVNDKKAVDKYLDILCNRRQLRE